MEEKIAWILGLGGGIVGVAILGILLLAAVLWVFLPFAVFGVKDHLASVRSEVRRTNKLLETLIERIGNRPGAPDA